MKEKEKVSLFFQIFAYCFLIIIVIVVLVVIDNQDSDLTSPTKNTYTIYAKTYEYGSIAVTNSCNLYTITDPPEYPNGTVVKLIVYDNETKDKIDDDTVVYVEEVQ